MGGGVAVEMGGGGAGLKREGKKGRSRSRASVIIIIYQAMRGGRVGAVGRDLPRFSLPGSGSHHHEHCGLKQAFLSPTKKMG